MKNLNVVIVGSALLLASAVASAEKHENPCPSELVNFWKTYAVNTDNYSAIPEFLLRNECFRARVSTDFHTAMVSRFDHPENPRFVDELYAQLDWKSGSISEQQ